MRHLYSAAEAEQAIKAARAVAPTLTDLLLWLRVQGSVLPPAPEGWTGADINRRTQDEVHDCLACGRRARCAFVAETDFHGDRWLDLCARCTYEVRQASDAAAAWAGP